MKCEHLIKIQQPAEIILNVGTPIGAKFPNPHTVIITPIDIIICKATIEQCPKKKQPCEINRRCWELGK